MGSTTPNYDLYLSGITEHVDINRFNDNFTAVDTALTDIAALAGDTTINVVIQHATPDPNTLSSTYLWIQTGLAPGGTGIAFWVETGA